MAAEFLFPPGRDLAFLLLALIYPCLIAVTAMTAVFSSKPARRKAALEVLRLLLPGRRGQPADQIPARKSRRRDPPAIRSPNP